MGISGCGFDSSLVQSFLPSGDSTLGLRQAFSFPLSFFFLPMSFLRSHSVLFLSIIPFAARCSLFLPSILCSFTLPSVFICSFHRRRCGCKMKVGSR